MTGRPSGEPVAGGGGATGDAVWALGWLAAQIADGAAPEPPLEPPGGAPDMDGSGPAGPDGHLTRARALGIAALLLGTPDAAQEALHAALCRLLLTPDDAPRVDPPLGLAAALVAEARRARPEEHDGPAPDGG
ncbi:hypothetical protein ACFOVU_26680 [Nocardiopsis sediminis]|uniref:Uncharacterized protein n=1 Tax=Nocardiopsis sediminis TaxID=1778267 RepID=A0ABV8FUF6_9ACTN